MPVDPLGVEGGGTGMEANTLWLIALWWMEANPLWNMGTKTKKTSDLIVSQTIEGLNVNKSCLENVANDRSFAPGGVASGA